MVHFIELNFKVLMEGVLGFTCSSSSGTGNGAAHCIFGGLLSNKSCFICSCHFAFHFLVDLSFSLLKKIILL